MSLIAAMHSPTGGAITASEPKCSGWCDNNNPVTHIGDKGYAYCADCAERRRDTGYERVRKMRGWELDILRSGKPLLSYKPVTRQQYEDEVIVQHEVRNTDARMNAEVLNVLTGVTWFPSEEVFDRVVKVLPLATLAKVRAALTLLHTSEGIGAENIADVARAAGNTHWGETGLGDLWRKRVDPMPGDDEPSMADVAIDETKRFYEGQSVEVCDFDGDNWRRAIWQGMDRNGLTHRVILMNGTSAMRPGYLIRKATDALAAETLSTRVYDALIAAGKRALADEYVASLQPAEEPAAAEPEPNAPNKYGVRPTQMTVRPIGDAETRLQRFDTGRMLIDVGVQFKEPITGKWSEETRDAISGLFVQVRRAACGAGCFCAAEVRVVSGATVESKVGA